jgi:hypothetical protein
MVRLLLADLASGEVPAAAGSVLPTELVVRGST